MVSKSKYISDFENLHTTGKLTCPMSKIFKIEIFVKNCFSLSEVYPVAVYIWCYKTIGKVMKINYPQYPMS